MKDCIACAEEIKQNAKLCKHCGTRQDDPAQVETPPQVELTRLDFWRLLNERDFQIDKPLPDDEFQARETWLFSWSWDNLEPYREHDMGMSIDYVDMPFIGRQITITAYLPYGLKPKLSPYMESQGMSLSKGNSQWHLQLVSKTTITESDFERLLDLVIETAMDFIDDWDG